MTSYLFNLKPGDNKPIFGPFGDFFANEGKAEMIFIGGGRNGTNEITYF
ncbi:MAG: hypothetical protein CM1200mP12_16450 [Gammaproteobacteria bacterium]|nr:MAG: hypothetical protein CM1200mP12_16450 [Gammaproteobacteria bacterium]